MLLLEFGHRKKSPRNSPHLRFFVCGGVLYAVVQQISDIINIVQRDLNQVVDILS